MKLTTILVRCSWLFFLAGCVSTNSDVPAAGSLIIGRVIKEPGMFQPAQGKCKATLDISELGGFQQLTISRTTDQHSKGKSEAKDVTGIAWISDNDLVYTVSPIYGQPGIFLFDCASMQTKRILGPKNADTAYPDGTDDFELQSVSFDRVKKLFFFYAPNVDQVDFKKFRTKDFLYQINLDGTGFRRAE